MRRPIWILLAAALSTALLAFAQEAEPPTATEDSVDSAAAEEADDGLFFDTVDVNVVNVDVYVTDKQGNPITGLSKDDFEVLENKRPVTVSNFYAVEGGRPLTAPRGPQIAEAPPRPGEEPLPLLPEEQRLSLVVYVDNFNLRPFSRNRTFTRLREFLHDHVDREDRVMLVSYDRSLHVRHPFTSDSALIANALYELEDLTGHRVHFDSERLELLRLLQESENLGEVEWRVQQFAESSYSDLLFTIDAMSELVDSLAGLEGRKALVYLSDGLQMTAAEDLYYGMQQKFGVSSVMARMSEFRATRRFQQLAHKASANRVVFYTIDAAGLRVSTSASAEMGAAGTAGLGSFVDSVYTSNLQSPLLFLAEQTGGRAIINTNDIGDGLDKVAADFDSYYSLGYVPAHAGDGRWHPIEVKLKKRRKGVQIRHRQGYRDKSVYARMAAGTQSSLLYGLQSNDMGIEIRFGNSTQDEQGQYDVAVAVAIPIGNVTLVPRDEFHVARLKLFFSALDEKERQAEVSEVPINIRIPVDQLEEARGQFYIYEAALKMRGGAHRVAVGVRDEIGAVQSFVTRNVNIGSG